MKLDIEAHIYNHPTDGELLVANAALSTELSNLSTVLSGKDSTIASLSAGSNDSGAVSAAVDAEDTEVANQISAALAADADASTSTSVSVSTSQSEVDANGAG